jgi:hypothetical protein
VSAAIAVVAVPVLDNLASVHISGVPWLYSLRFFLIGVVWWLPLWTMVLLACHSCRHLHVAITTAIAIALVVLEVLIVRYFGPIMVGFIGPLVVFLDVAVHIGVCGIGSALGVAIGYMGRMAGTSDTGESMTVSMSAATPSTNSHPRVT